MDDKIIISNRGALLSKYGSKGLTAIRKALTALAAADKKRGISSRVLYLDDKAGMKKLRLQGQVLSIEFRIMFEQSAFQSLRQSHRAKRQGQFRMHSTCLGRY